MEGRNVYLKTISYKIKKARKCTKKDTLQRLEADLHAKQACKYTTYFSIRCSGNTTKAGIPSSFYLIRDTPIQNF